MGFWLTKKNNSIDFREEEEDYEDLFVNKDKGNGENWKEGINEKYLLLTISKKQRVFFFWVFFLVDFP